MKTARLPLHLLVLLAISLLPSGFIPCANAQTNYAIPWFKIAGGGATAPSTGGVYTLSGTIGQPDAGRVATTNDSFRLEGGFWGIAVQQAGYPVLTLTRSGTNAFVTWVTAETLHPPKRHQPRHAYCLD
ncbi:MAG: hypothetical protein HY301_18040 [Verrucomicrobia bacterium]|nr:hypothetical protein [Verrucomicrobiota bacterium]